MTVEPCQVPVVIVPKVIRLVEPATGEAPKLVRAAVAVTAAGAGTVALGQVSEKYESNGSGVGTVSGGMGGKDPGGVSYGKYQLASKNGSMQEFLNSTEGKPFKESFTSVAVDIFFLSYLLQKLATKDGLEPPF